MMLCLLTGVEEKGERAESQGGWIKKERAGLSTYKLLLWGHSLILLGCLVWILVLQGMQMKRKKNVPRWRIWRCTVFWLPYSWNKKYTQGRARHTMDAWDTSLVKAEDHLVHNSPSKDIMTMIFFNKSLPRAFSWGATRSKKLYSWWRRTSCLMSTQTYQELWCWNAGTKTQRRCCCKR